jgi:hypothetical protein
MILRSHPVRSERQPVATVQAPQEVRPAYRLVSKGQPHLPGLAAVMVDRVQVVAVAVVVLARRGLLASGALVVRSPPRVMAQVVADRMVRVQPPGLMRLTRLMAATVAREPAGQVTASALSRPLAMLLPEQMVAAVVAA